ncbi:PLC-like phosphodiesterase [Patellaria atrata CBS 101060]|uniref:Phosphoinositide phospholipase C n=1 Tax=Patellaria atrata CBS 101060 TaxID=1346257 RepID=A0A9P4SHM0_9PEZI|nr:PLC-like phosphodiesterase [Patellaria atrata CBS 101060]
MADPSSSLATRISSMNPFSKSRPREDEEDLGEETDFAGVAEGAYGTRRTEIKKSRLRISNALKSLLANEGVLSSEDAASDSNEPSNALRALLNKPHAKVPAYVSDRSHPLPEYFISSSHNTYLIAHQLYGSSSATAYETALTAGSRCVEIDAWDNDNNPEEPKVTHGYTMVSNIPFRSVCETIRDVVDKEASRSMNEQGYRAAPIFLSLENHCSVNGQLRLVQIMNEVWGNRLLTEAIRQKGHDEQEGGSHVTLDELGSKIVVIVEYHFPNEADNISSDSDSSESEEEEEKEARHAYKKKKNATPPTIIIPELAAMGVYAQSVKPNDNSWFEDVLRNAPHHHLINVSEVGLGAHMPTYNMAIARHNARHLMRVFPKGSRISSRNLHPVPFWGLGAQICALNWQTFGASMQINEAMFSGTDGFVLKPAALRAGGNGELSTGRRMKLRLRVAGASDVPVPEGRDEGDIRPYLTCSLIHPTDLKGDPPKRKTGQYRQHKLGFVHRGENPPVTDPIWNETLDWEYDDNELVFLRLLIKSDDKFASNPKLAAAAVRLLYVTPGWSFIPMLDLKGRQTNCSLLVLFEFEHL